MLLNQDFPTPLSGKTGWPWTEETPPLPETMPDGSPWPRISIVTPSYNQGQFIEETIRSVLLQGYPNLEYIIIDGGSTDGSVEIIKKYERWLAYWESKPDGGMYDAINNGIQLITGDLIGFCNADDFYEKGAFCEVAHIAGESKTSYLICGDCRMFVMKSGYRQISNVFKAPESERLTFQSIPFINPCFFSRHLLKHTSSFDAVYRIVGDLDFIMRVALFTPLIKKTGTVTYNYRLHEAALTNTVAGVQNPDWPLEVRRLSLQWLNNKWLPLEAKRFCENLLAKANLRLATLSIRDQHWENALMWFWEGLRHAPWPMLFRTIRYFYIKSKRRVQGGFKGLRSSDAFKSK